VSRAIIVDGVRITLNVSLHIQSDVEVSVMT
jgi:hypothetical protein